ncbi:hypothetical protein B0T22DRAFT_264782 [Podospora appendiculata]|uniref:Uncharacterized protein n=1 Tax=Podospora appendiculata TaxID=314037 RepID=A0AAE0X3P6_9PEZI|nr:hypothetical protein B0T22DRAFT_264782 [Podospora appendiculata]
MQMQMQMEHPPSYQDAIRQLDWLEIVAPYIYAGELARLCLVSKRFYHQFAPRLWNDPLPLARQLGLQRDAGKWHEWSVLEHLDGVGAATSRLIASLDLRGFGMDVQDFFFGGKDRSRSLRRLSSAFPNLRCILLDDNQKIDVGQLASPEDPDSLTSPTFEGPMLLSMARCRTELPKNFFESLYLKHIVYLDVSDMPGALGLRLIQSPTGLQLTLPHLRILKTQNRELDDLTALQFLGRKQLWSLDLSRNRITDRLIDLMCDLLFDAGTPRPSSETHFDVEGALSYPLEGGNDFYGRFGFIKESEWSATFSHPERYIADAPLYHQDYYGTPKPFARLDGRVKIKDDSVNLIKTILSVGWECSIPSVHDVRALDVCRHEGGVTHLYLNQNNVSASALARLVRTLPGQLERLECDSPLLVSANLREGFFRPRWIPRTARLSGILGLAHTFRPVISSNLQVLRIHHSLVTQLPSLEATDLSTLENLWLAETFLLPRAELAYPQSFVPDMNPRLRSLTLARIPRYSTGRLTSKIIRFLKLAAMQEQAVQETAVSARRGPTKLLGLRHIRLEFEPETREGLANYTDVSSMLEMSPTDFSFYSDWKSSPASTPTLTPSTTANAPPTSAKPRSDDVNGARTNKNASAPLGALPPPSPAPPPHESDSVRLEPFPPTETRYTYLPCVGTWKNGTQFTVPVWTGSGTAGSAPPTQQQAQLPNSVDEYTRLLRKDPTILRANVQPASPCHVAAGVPPGSYIFAAAWEAMLAPPDMRHPSREELEGMYDVVVAIKAYRAGTRRAYEMAQKVKGVRYVKLGEPHWHWTGQLEVSTRAVEEGDFGGKLWQ